MNLARYQQLLLLEQSLFGLPWLVAAILFALISPGASHLIFPSPLFWAALLVAFLAARALGMSLNRLIDYQIDGKNPRTSKRPLQIGLVSRDEVKWVILATSVVFLAACAYLNPLCLLLSPIVLALLFAYSFTKRFTALCHFFLGAVHFFAPIFAWAALLGTIEITPVLIGCSLWLFIAGNDMVYALQDRDFDLQEGLRSIPARMGTKVTLRMARLIHFVALLPLITLGLISELSLVYYLGVALMAALYLYYHLRLRRKGEFEQSFTACNLYGGLLFLATSIGVAIW